MTRKPPAGPLNARLRRAAGWPERKPNPQCKRCGDAGWFFADVGQRGEVAYTWACTCPAGDAAPKGLPRWREPRVEPRPPLPPAPVARRDAAAGPDDD